MGQFGESSDPISNSSPKNLGLGLVLERSVVWSTKKKRPIKDILKDLNNHSVPSFFSFLLPSRDRKFGEHIVTLPSEENTKGVSSTNSSNYSDGLILCCESINDYDVQKGNSRFWKEIDGNIPINVWKSIKKSRY